MKDSMILSHERHLNFWPFLNREKAKIFMTSIVMSNPSYCPLIWMFCSKSTNKEHLRNLQNLMTEIYKTINQMNPAYIREFFVEKDMPYNLYTKVLCRLPQAPTNRYGLESLSYLEVVYYGIH